MQTATRAPFGQPLGVSLLPPRSSHRQLRLLSGSVNGNVGQARNFLIRLAKRATEGQ